jgi:translation initiation factor IF-2
MKTIEQLMSEYKVSKKKIMQTAADLSLEIVPQKITKPQEKKMVEKWGKVLVTAAPKSTSITKIPPVPTNTTTLTETKQILDTKKTTKITPDVVNKPATPNKAIVRKKIVDPASVENDKKLADQSAGNAASVQAIDAVLQSVTTNPQAPTESGELATTVGVEPKIVAPVTQIKQYKSHQSNATQIWQSKKTETAKPQNIFGLKKNSFDPQQFAEQKRKAEELLAKENQASTVKKPIASGNTPTTGTILSLGTPKNDTNKNTKTVNKQGQTADKPSGDIKKSQDVKKTISDTATGGTIGIKFGGKNSVVIEETAVKSKIKKKKQDSDFIDPFKHLVEEQIYDMVDPIGIPNLNTNDQSLIQVRTITNKKKKTNKEFTTPKTTANPTKQSKMVVEIHGVIAVSELASQMNQKVGEVIKSLFSMGMMATANQTLDYDTAALVATELGYEAVNIEVSFESIINTGRKNTVDAVMKNRPPVVTIMGHVDHGKTSLLDAIRSTNVVATEAGGITQKIGAYQIEFEKQKITFLDTPGHEAFSAMRQRGVQVTDIVILVVAADDGIRPQTKEAIAHALNAKVPIIVAVNKMDKEGADFDRVLRELSENGLQPEAWGGDIMCIPCAAKKRQGLKEVLEAILLQAEILSIQSSTSGYVEAVVIESRLDKFMGSTASIVVTKGVMAPQMSFVVGGVYGKVRSMVDDKGKRITEAYPSTPVEITGLTNGVPLAGDVLYHVDSESLARDAAQFRATQLIEKELAQKSQNQFQEFVAVTTETSDIVEIIISLKTDTQGSLEAIQDTIQKRNSVLKKGKIKILSGGVGSFTESDLLQASNAQAILVAFNLKIDRSIVKLIENKSLTYIESKIIYEVLDALNDKLIEKLPSTVNKVLSGSGHIIQTFKVPKIGMIAGVKVTQGKIVSSGFIHVYRNNKLIHSAALASLKKEKDEVKEVNLGFNAGILLNNYEDFLVDDRIECYIEEHIKQTLE